MTATNLAEIQSIPCRIIRGGTSKGVFFRADALPADPEQRDAILLRIMGSPDPRQINGLGGADPLTSKIALIDDGAAKGADITYLFGAVGIDRAYVNYSANCGNLTVAAAVFAIDEGYVKAVAPETKVTIFNVNSGKLINVWVPVDENGRAATKGDYHNPGVPGTGAEFKVDFSKTAGSTLDGLLPTGKPMDTLEVTELGLTLDVSIVDIGKICCFFRARDIGLTGTEGPAELTAEIMAKYWAIRDAAANMLGIPLDMGHLPTPVSIAPPTTYKSFMTGEAIEADQMTVCARRIVGPPPRLHKAFAGSGATCTAVAGNIPGTIVNEAAAGDTTHFRLGHPTGVFPLEVEMGPDLEVRKVAFSRSARTIMVGNAYLED